MPKKHAKPAKPIGRRRTGFRETRKVILIICEGEKTEPNYFNAMAKHLRINAIVEIDGTGRNTVDLVNYASERSSEDFDQIWCVFDKDDFSDEHFNNAVQKDGQGKIRIAYSNESFELWYVLHYNYHIAKHKRTQYIPLLSKLMKEKYSKNRHDIYEKLSDKLEQATKRAQKLFKEHEKTGCTPSQANPCTTVHLLVLRLQEIAKEQELD